MKYKLETIPVWNAYQSGADCPLCYLENKAENVYLKFFLGSSVMAPEMRVEVNQTGFCQNHFFLLYEREGKLGLALMTHTHMLELHKKLRREMKHVLKNASSAAGALSGLLPGKTGAGLKRRVFNLSESLKEESGKCMICRRVDQTMARYAFTILYLWQKDDEFREAFQRSKGFCLRHFKTMLNMSHQELSHESLTAWLEAVIPMQEDDLKQLESKLLNFTRQYDYRKSGDSWEGVRDALPRGIRKLVGRWQCRSDSFR